MSSRNDLDELAREYLRIRPRVNDVGYALDGLHARAQAASPALGTRSLALIETTAALSNDLVRMAVALEKADAATD